MSSEDETFVVLVGLLLGVAHTLLALTGPLVVNAIKGEPPINVSPPPPNALHAITHVLDFGIDVVQIGALMMMALVILTMVLRKRVLAVGMFALLNLAFFVLAVRSEPRYIPFFVIVVVLITFATLRYGLLAAGLVQSVTLLLFAVKPAGPAWILTSSAIVLLAFLALAIWAFRTSLGGQSPFSASLLDE